MAVLCLVLNIFACPWGTIVAAIIDERGCNKDLTRIILMTFIGLPAMFILMAILAAGAGTANETAGAVVGIITALTWFVAVPFFVFWHICLTFNILKANQARMGKGK